jgi:hypothetical protein
MAKRKARLKTYIISPLESVAQANKMEVEEVITFREVIKEEIGSFVEIIDPIEHQEEKCGMNLEEAFELLTELRERGKYKAAAVFTYPIVDIDLEAVRNSTFVIAYIHSKYPTTGGIHELAEACNHKVPIYLVTDNLKKLSFWAMALVYRSKGELFGSVRDLLDFIKEDYSIG